METGSDETDFTPSSKKRKHESAVDASSDVGEGSVVGSELEDLA